MSLRPLNQLADDIAERKQRYEDLQEFRAMMDSCARQFKDEGAVELGTNVEREGNLDRITIRVTGYFESATDIPTEIFDERAWDNSKIDQKAAGVDKANYRAYIRETRAV